MSIAEQAIRAAMVADPHFSLNRRPKLAERCLEFIAANPLVHAEPVYIYAQQAPAWNKAKPETRTAWEIFRATVTILKRAEQGEAIALLKLTKSRAPLAPAFMLEPEEEEPELGELIVPLPQPPPAPAATPGPELLKTKAKRKASA